MVLLLLLWHLPSHSDNVDSAFKYLQVREISRNSSPEIDKWIKVGGGRKRDAWCMFFVYGISVSDGKTKLARTGSCSAQLRHAHRIGSGLKVVPFTQFGSVQTKRNDIIIWKSGDARLSDIGRLWYGHTGFVVKDYGDIWQTIEGNTGPDGSRDGDGVYLKRRLKKKQGRLSPIAIIRE